MSLRDVLVVGGGPAGATTALLLARAGFDVEVLDRHDFPRAKPCGECVSPGANAIFERLGVLSQIEALQCARLDGWLLRASPEAAFTSFFRDGNRDSKAHYAFAIEREKLDMLLLEAARSAGARIRTRAQVTALWREPTGDMRVSGIVDGHELQARARLIIGADGLRSRIARLMNAHARPPRLRKLSLTAHVRNVPAVGHLGEMHLAADACLGIAPVQQDSNPLCNITTVIRADCVPAHKSKPELMQLLLRRFPQRDLSHLITESTEILASGPFDWPTRRIVFDGVALVGDAAGYYDPFTGQGIFQALAGAERLARHATLALAQRAVSRSLLAGYQVEQRALVGSAHRVQRAIEFVCGHAPLAELLFSALKRAPNAAARLLAVTGDTRPARDLLSPLWLASLVRAVALNPAA